MLIAPVPGRAAGDGRSAVPGEADALRIEGIYYREGPRQALQALAQDYVDAFGDAGTEASRQRIGDEVSRLEAHTTRYAQYSPLVGIATQWCLEQHGPGDFPLGYTTVLPARDASPDTPAAVLELDRQMAKVVQDNWISYGNLTRSHTGGYITDVNDIAIESSEDLRRDQQDQEDVRAAANALTDKAPHSP